MTGSFPISPDTLIYIQRERVVQVNRLPKPNEQESNDDE